MSERIITFGEATREAMLEEMRVDERVFVYGEDIANEDGTYNVTYVVLDRDGNELFTCRDYYLTQFGDRVIFADDTSYRMTNLAGHDILRLSRWELLDFPADD